MLNWSHFEDVMKKTASSLGHSLSYYWPADADGRNDPDESNIAFHMAHSLLNAGYAVFAEANHPCPPIQGIDLLAISSARDFFVATEIKRHFRFMGMDDSEADVKRLRTFWLNAELRLERCGADPIQVLNTCKTGYGIVAGLRWVGIGGDSRLLESMKEGKITKTIQEIGGMIGNPIRVYEYNSASVKGTYYLQYACFPIHGLSTRQ